MTLPDKEIMCHHTGFEKRCFDMVVHSKCRKWVHVQGKNPQTNGDVDTFDCRDHVDHMLTIAILQAQRQTTATVDALRKEVNEGNDQSMTGLIGNLNRQMESVAAIAAPATAKLIGS